MTEQIEKMVEGVLLAMKSYVAKRLEGVLARLEAVEKRQPEKGEPGAKGEKGPDGAKGNDGAKGDRGDQGEKGDRGEKGDAGEKGDPGDPGKPGDRGEPGAKGEQGPPGESVKGDKGEKGEPGERGEMGKKGEQGEVGRDGQKGAPGRDALHLEILAGIDKTKSYQRCTFATHRGGLWRSFETTDGMKGWECIVDGDAEDVIEQDEDLRTFTFRKVKSSGRIVETKAVLPVVLYRGIWEERAYDPGDSTTRDGCQWIARAAAAPTDVPGSSDVWKMSVKKGRDGRDGLRGEPGARGAQGKDGRDLTQVGDGKKW